MSTLNSPEFNPILTQLVKKMPEVPPHGILIAKRKKDGVFVSLGGGRLSAGELLFSSYDGFAVVDNRPHAMSFVTKLPSTNDSYRFIAEIDLQVRAADPVSVLCSGVTDTRKFLLGRIEKSLRCITASKTIEERDKVEKDCQRALETFVLDGGLEVSKVVVRIDLDEDARKVLAAPPRIKEEDEERARRIRTEDEERARRIRTEDEERARRIRTEDEERRRQEEERKRRTTENEQDINAGTQRLTARLLAEHPEVLPELIKEFKTLEHLEASSRYELFKKILERPDLEGTDFLEEFRSYVREFLNRASKRLPLQQTIRAELSASTASARNLIEEDESAAGE